MGATWSEFDLHVGVWTIPAARMKGGESHTVHLTPRALEIIESMLPMEQPFVFPPPVLDKKPMSNMAMLNVLRRMKFHKRTTVHGLCRATFSTWAYETAAARPDVIEACLAHKETDRIKAAYNRAQFSADRKELLFAWSRFLVGQTKSNVVSLRVAA